MRVPTLLSLLLATVLGGCGVGVGFGGPSLISGHSIAEAQSQSSEPQSVDSLPLDAAGLPSGPNGRAPNAASVHVGAGVGRATY